MFRFMRWIVSRVAPVVLSLAVWQVAAAAPVQLDRLMLLPGDARLAPAAGTQESPRIAAGGSGYLVVWSDHRSALTTLVAFSGGPYLSPGIGSMRDIYAARLDASGALLDSIPILVAQQTLNQGFPAVAWNGHDWLVAWSGQTDMACCPNARIFAARVSPAGAVLDPTPIAVATEPEVDGWYGPAVASDGSSWAVVYRSWNATVSMLVGRRVGADGTVLDLTPRELRHDSWNSYPIHPDLVFAGDTYLLVWAEDDLSGHEGAVRGQRLTSTLARVGGVIALNAYTPSTGHHPRVATDGTTFFTAWFEDRYTGFAQVFGTRVSHLGTVLDPAGIALTPASGYAQFLPAVAWDGSRWMVGYHTNDLFVRRVSSAGALLDPTGLLVKAGVGGGAQPDMVAASGGGVRFAWKDTRAPGPAPEDIYAIGASGTGTPGAEACVSLGAPRQTAARLVVGGGGQLLVFRSQISGKARILAQRLDDHGIPRDAGPIEVAAGPNLSAPGAAWDGAEFLVTWQDATVPAIYGRRMRADGSFLDASPRTFLTAYTPVVAALGGTFLVAGVFDPDPHYSEPRYVRMRGSDGAILDPVPFVLGRGFSVLPALTTVGTRWLLAWEEHPTHDNPAASVIGALIGADGNLAGSVSATGFAVGSQYTPSVATRGDTAMLAWQDARSGNNSTDVYVQRLLPDGTRLDGNGVRLTSAINDQRTPAAAWDGREFVVAFGDDRNEGTPGVDQFRGDVFAARIAAAGVILDPSGFAVSTDSVMESQPVSGGVDGVTLAGCSIFESAPYASYRIGVRVDGGTVGVDDRRAGALWLRVAPNPSAHDTGIELALPRTGAVRVVIHDLMGREVRRLDDGVHTAGVVRLRWDGRDNRGARVASGVYLVSATAEGRTSTVRIARFR